MDDTCHDLGAPEPFGGRAQRFAEECARFERAFGITLAGEIDGVVPDGHLEKIKHGEMDVVEELRLNDLWSVLLSLGIDLGYILWNRRQSRG